MEADWRSWCSEKVRARARRDPGLRQERLRHLDPIYTAYEPSYLAKFNKTEGGRLFQDVSLTGPGVRKGECGLPWRGIDPTAGGRHWQPPSSAYEVYEALQGESLADLPILERLDRFDAAGLIYWPKQGAGVPRFKQFLDAMPGLPAQDVITDIPPINSQAAERLGYLTQKPLGLLERIITASSNPGDLVLDPFCGCGTTVDAAQKLGRRWVGIDITYLAVDLIEKRLRHTYGDAVDGTYEVIGTPRDLDGARALFARNPFDFERWAVSLVDAQPNAKQVGDKGIDGIGRFPIDNQGTLGKVIVQVKGGRVGPSAVRDLIGTVGSQRAAAGVLITLEQPTGPTLDAARHSGLYVHPATKRQYPVVQAITVEDLLAGRRPFLPTLVPPYVQAKAYAGQQATLFG